MKRVLRSLAFFYQLGSGINNFLFECGLRKTHRIPTPVISVGNLAFGGSEKTPLVMHLLSFFKKHKMNPALITRGYRGGWEKSGGVLSGRTNGHGTWQEAGDEPFMVWRRLPSTGIFIGKNRLDSCRKAEKAGFSPLILDDGFQHRQLLRDLDIVLIAPEEKIAFRESVSSLRRADIVLVKGKKSSDAQRWRKHLSSGGKIFSYSVKNTGFFSYPDNNRIPQDRLRNLRLLAVCGIARPERFFSLLAEQGVKTTHFLAFPDHHAYPISSKKKVTAFAQRTESDGVITTEKDVFKLDDIYRHRQIPIYYIQIDLQVEHGFYRELDFLKENM